MYISQARENHQEKKMKAIQTRSFIYSFYMEQFFIGSWQFDVLMAHSNGRRAC